METHSFPERFISSRGRDSLLFMQTLGVGKDARSKRDAPSGKESVKSSIHLPFKLFIPKADEGFGEQCRIHGVSSVPSSYITSAPRLQMDPSK